MIQTNEMIQTIGFIAEPHILYHGTVTRMTNSTI